MKRGIRLGFEDNDVGVLIQLRSGGVPGFGGLNDMFLREERYFGGYVPISEVKPDGSAVVTLPSGYKLSIVTTDVL